MTRRRSLPMAFAAALALVCCVGIGGAGLAVATQSLGPAARTSTALIAVRQAAQHPPLPPVPINVTGSGRAYGMRPGSAFAGNFLGGFLGAGFGGLLFGGRFFDAMHGPPGVLGVLAQILLVYAIGLWTYLSCAATLAPAGAAARGRLLYPNSSQQHATPRTASAGSSRRPIALNAADLRTFEQLLHCLQTAWCAQDMHAVRTLTTPDMAESYLRRMSDLQCLKLRDVVSNLVIQCTETIAAWSDGHSDFATLRFSYTMTNATLDIGDRTVKGSLTEPVTMREHWRFQRTPRGHWLISAIEHAV